MKGDIFNVYNCTTGSINKEERNGRFLNRNKWAVFFPGAFTCVAAEDINREKERFSISRPACAVMSLHRLIYTVYTVHLSLKCTNGAYRSPPASLSANHCITSHGIIRHKKILRTCLLYVMCIVNETKQVETTCNCFNLLYLVIFILIETVRL